MSPNLDSNSSGATGGGGLGLGVLNRGQSKPNAGNWPEGSRREHHPAWARYAVAVVAVALGWLAREALNSSIGHDRLPFIFFFPAIAIAAWYGGLGPGVLAVVLGGMASDWYYIGPRAFGLRNAYDIAAICGYVLGSAFIVAAIDSMHRAQRRLLGEIEHREKVQAALREEQERDLANRQIAERTSARLAAIVEFSGDAILTKDLDGVVQSWNAAAQKLFGYSVEEIVGRPVTVLFPKERLTEEDHILARLRKGQAVERLETIRVCKDGHQIHVSVSISPLKDSHGTVIGASKIIHDISARVAAQEALLEEKEQLATTLSSIGDAVILTDADGKITFLNPEAERLTQWKSDDAAGQDLVQVFRIINAHTRLPVEDPVAKVIRLGTVVGLANSTILIAKNGIETPINDSAAPIRRPGGPLFGIVLVFRDFSEHEQTQQEQETLFALVQAVNQARALPDIYEAALSAIKRCLKAERSSILFLDSDGVMRFKAWAGLSDEYRKAVEGHSPWPSDTRDPQPVCISDTSQAALELRPVFEHEGIKALAFIPITYEARLLGKFMVYYNQRHQFTENELRLGLTVASQVALAVQRRRAEEELETLVRERTSKLQEMMAELQHVSYAITHDMRAPLRAMSTFAGIILDEVAQKPDSAPELLDSCRRIIASASRLDQLIQDALNYTKAVLQELPLHPVNLAQLIPSLIESYPNLQAEKADIKIEDPLPTVLGEESLLTQCFSNLLGNAVKFVAPGTRPQVSVRVDCSNGTARITIQDNGIGIPRESQRRLFGMFERLTTGYEGTGIGLAIVRKVVERMGGKVGVVSAPGEGSRFWVELRAAPSQPVKAAPTSANS
jgi:PAS domain S-box-containing protein